MTELTEEAAMTVVALPLHVVARITGVTERTVRYWIAAGELDAYRQSYGVRKRLVVPGSGTALLVADRLGRDAIGIELNESYCEIARKRITDDKGALLNDCAYVLR